MLNTAIIDVTVWSVSRGASFLKSSRLGERGLCLFAVDSVPANDIVAFVPRSLAFTTQSPLRYESTFLRPSPHRHRMATTGSGSSDGDDTEQQLFEQAACFSLVTYNQDLLRSSHQLQRSVKQPLFRPLCSGEAAHLSHLSAEINSTLTRCADSPWPLRDEIMAEIASPQFDSALSGILLPRLAHSIFSAEKNNNKNDNSNEGGGARNMFASAFLNAMLAIELRGVGPERALIPFLSSCPRKYTADAANCRIGIVDEENDPDVAAYLIGKGLKHPASSATAGGCSVAQQIDGYVLQTTRPIAAGEMFTVAFEEQEQEHQQEHQQQ